MHLLSLGVVNHSRRSGNEIAGPRCPESTGTVWTSLTTAPGLEGASSQSILGPKSGLSRKLGLIRPVSNTQETKEIHVLPHSAASDHGPEFIAH